MSLIVFKITTIILLMLSLRMWKVIKRQDAEIFKLQHDIIMCILLRKGTRYH